MSISKFIASNWADLSVRAQNHIRATRPHLIELWECMDDDTCYTQLERADSAEEALDAFESTYSRSMYDLCDPDDTVYVGISARNTVTGEEARRTIELYPDAPACTRAEHAWRAPHDLVGGMVERPGVWSDGPGIRSVHVCAHCGVYRETRSHAQTDDGCYGAAVSYRPADDNSLAWVRSQRRSAQR